MALRLLEVLLPTDTRNSFLETVENAGYEAPFAATPEDGRTHFRLLVNAEHAGPLVDAIEKRFGATEGFHLVIFRVEAALPRRESEEEAPETARDDPSRIGTTGVSREELYTRVRHMIGVDPTLLATVALSTVVAAVGMLRDSVAIIIGAMVIAPLLGPNVALALATALGDMDLLRRAARTGLAGVGLAGTIAFVLGLTLTVNPTLAAIASRTTVELSDLVLALASGGAAVLAITRGISSALVGVMVAVALLPPTVAVGLMAGSGRLVEALNASMLLLANVICVNLAGVVTFLVQGVRPLNWWEASRARRAQRLAIGIWAASLGLLTTLIVLSK